ncbi:hypothetical protein [Actinacidiphila rubida]|nr:hypothetical protein [Actinacidiphila rubida]
MSRLTAEQTATLMAALPVLELLLTEPEPRRAPTPGEEHAGREPEPGPAAGTEPADRTERSGGR